MKITSNNIRIFSSIFHGVFAGIVVFTLLALIAYRFTHESFILWGTSVICGFFWGWLFGSWYVPIKNTRWFFEPYIVTPLISLLSAVVSGLVFVLADEIDSRVFDLVNVIGTGFFIGIYAFLITLPITMIAGLIVALYLYKFGGYQGVPE